MKLINRIISLVLSIVIMTTIFLFIRYSIFYTIHRIIIIIILLGLMIFIWIRTLFVRSAIKRFFRIIIECILITFLIFIDINIYKAISFWDNLYKKGKKVAQEQNVDTFNQPFNIYISGNDNEDDISKDSRSDVNILMSVNPNTKKILLTNTPRDTYVAINGDENKMDKLTHAGIYGVFSSQRALEKLYETKINYYIKFNFNSFVDIIDAVGGIDVQSDEEFISYGGEKFVKGKNKLDGKKALQFVRERYSFSNGDIKRGQHQLEVIKELFNKITSIDGIKKIDKLLECLDKAIISNIPAKQMVGIFNTIIKNPFEKYYIDSQYIYGNSTLDLPSYAAPNSRIYVMVTDKKILKEARNKIYNILR